MNDLPLDDLIIRMYKQYLNLDNKLHECKKEERDMLIHSSYQMLQNVIDFIIGAGSMKSKNLGSGMKIEELLQYLSELKKKMQPEVLPTMEELLNRYKEVEGELKELGFRDDSEPQDFET